MGREQPSHTAPHSLKKYPMSSDRKALSIELFDQSNEDRILTEALVQQRGSRVHGVRFPFSEPS